MSKLLKKFTAAMSAVAILFSIVTPVAGVNAAYSSSLDAANKLASVGVIVDQSANPADYRLGDNISRRELVKIAVLLSSAELNTAYAGKFSDVPQSDWAWKYAETAVDEGMIAANATFSPARNVTKAEALKMVMNATDVEKVGSDSVWAKNYVDGGVAAGIVETFSDYDTAAQRGWIFKVAANALEVASDGDDDLLDDLLDGLDDDSSTGSTDTGSTVSGDDVLTIALSADTPEGANIPSGVSGLPVAAYDFTAGSEDVTVTSVVLKRKGLSDKSTLGGLAAFSDEGRASKAKDDSQNNDTEATLSLTNGFVVKAGETRTLTIVADVNDSTFVVANDEFSIELVEVVASTTAEKDGSLVANSFRVGSVDAPKIVFDDNGTVSNPKLGAEGTDIFKFQVKGPNGEDVILKSLTFKADNSNAEDDLANFKLLKGTTEIAATASMNDKYLTFTLGDGLTITENKTEKFTVIADVVAGAGDIISFYVDKNLDISAEGTKYGYGASVDIATNVVNTPGTLGTLTLQAGELTLVDIDASSDKIRENKDDVVLGKIKVTNVAGKNLELQKFGVLSTVTLAGTFVDDGIGGGTADDNVQNGTEATVNNLDQLFENFELVNEDTGASYDLTRRTWGAILADVYQDLDLNVSLPQGVSNFVLKADTKDNLWDFDLTSVALSLDASIAGGVDANPANGQFIVVETDDDKLVTDLTPSSLTWKVSKGSESGATVALLPLSNISKVRGAEDVLSLQFEVEADESSALVMDEAKVLVDVAAVGAPFATNAEVSQVTLYEGSVSEANLLDRVSGSNLSAWVATFDGFDVAIAANQTKTFVVTVSIVDGAAAVANSPVIMMLQSVSLEDEDNDDVVATGTPTANSRQIAVTNVGAVTIVEDGNNDDNKDAKTILAGTSKKVFSADVQATNESVDVEKVVFTVDTNLTNAITNASLYLGDTLIATNANSDITANTITFDNLTTLIIPQESKELKLALNTATIWFEKVGLSVANVNVDVVSLEDIEGVDSGKVVGNQVIGVAGAPTLASSTNIAIVPAILTPSVAVSLSTSSTPQVRLTSDVGDNTRDTSNTKPNSLVNTISFSNLGTSITAAEVYTLTNTEDSSDTSIGTVVGNVVTFDLATDLSATNRTITAGGNETFKITVTGTAEGDTLSLTLLENGVNYDVEASWDGNDGTNTAGATIQLANELDFGTRSY